MKNTWLVAIIFSAQTVLLGAAPVCECVASAEAVLAETDCCTEDGTNRCDMSAETETASEPGAVAVSPEVELVATPVGNAEPAAYQTRSISLSSTAEPHPTGLWSEFVCAERAPPLS